MRCCCAGCSLGPAWVSRGVTFEEIGGSEQRYQAMKSGAAAATLLNPPFDESLLKDGYSRLARLTDAFPTYPGVRHGGAPEVGSRARGGAGCVHSCI